MKRVLSSVLAAGVAAVSCVALSTSGVSASVTRAYIPDNAFEQRLIDLGYDDALDDHVNLNNINRLKTLDLSGTALGDLSGIRYFSALETLNLSGLTGTLTQVGDDDYGLQLPGTLRNLDVSNSPTIQTIDVDSGAVGTNIETLNVAGSTSINSLYLNNNRLSSLDVTGLTSLSNLFVAHNNL